MLESLGRLAEAAWYDEGREAMVVDVLTWNELLAEARKEADGFVCLPVDADDVPWHVGDHAEGGQVVALHYVDEWLVELEDERWEPARSIAHERPDTWERIIEDAILRGYDEPHAEKGGYITKESLVARCVALAGGAS